MSHALLDVDLLARGGLAAALGVFIGIERQWRSRMAGLQTMALVSMGSALFVIFGAYAVHRRRSHPRRGANRFRDRLPRRGGVIIKQGAAVTGLNTAATLWATAAVGSLAGAWMWPEAIAGAIIIVLGNLGLHAVADGIDARNPAWVKRDAQVAVDIICSTDAEKYVRGVLLAATRGPRWELASIRTIAGASSDTVSMKAELSTPTRNHASLQKISRKLYTDLRVTSIEWTNEPKADIAQPD